MIRPDTGLRVYLCREPVDMRKQIDGLALLVQEAMELNPFEEAVFVFGNPMPVKLVGTWNQAASNR